MAQRLSCSLCPEIPPISSRPGSHMLRLFSSSCARETPKSALPPLRNILFAFDALTKLRMMASTQRSVISAEITSSTISVRTAFVLAGHASNFQKGFARGCSWPLPFFTCPVGMMLSLLSGALFAKILLIWKESDISAKMKIARLVPLLVAHCCLLAWVFRVSRVLAKRFPPFYGCFMGFYY
jgi:hypothetical protein